MQFGIGPCQLPTHRRPTSWVIDIAAPRVRGVGGRRSPTPYGWKKLYSFPTPVTIGVSGLVQCWYSTFNPIPIGVCWGGLCILTL